jgi:hypothetical protein
LASTLLLLLASEYTVFLPPKKSARNFTLPEFILF